MCQFPIFFEKRPSASGKFCGVMVTHVTCKKIDHHTSSPVENKDDLELDFKVFFFTDSCCSDIVHDESN